MRRFRLIALLFFFSGGTALLYQVAFGKKLATIFGATAYAVSAVLAAFMGGLALGSFLGGRWGKRVRRPLAAYGLAELLVGLVCLLTPWLFDGVASVYLGLVRRMPGSLAAVTLLRSLLTALVVVAPTVAMGATLPFLSRVVAGAGATADRQQDARRRLAWLYGVNTAGGAAGALVSAYAVLPWLGVYTTMRAAALVNFAIGGAAWWLGRAEVSVAAPEEVADAPAAVTPPSEDAPADPAAAASDSVGSTTGLPKRLLALLAFASGLLVFCAEVVDTHLLALLIGNSAYAFGLMLAAFLTCLSVGAALAGVVERRLGRQALPLSLLLTALVLLLTLPLWGKLPLAFLATGHRVSSWGGRELVRAMVAFAALLLPTTCMGLTFPLLLRQVAGDREVSQRVGRLTAINTLGSIVGSVCCGYFLLPALGSENSLRAVALAFACCGALAAWWLRPSVKKGEAKAVPRLPLVAFGLCLALALLLPRWDMLLMTNGANVYFDSQPRPDELVMVREDVHGGLTSVARRGDILTMYTNGKFQGDNGAEVTAQRSFAHFPSLFVGTYQEVLVIGLGTGTTLGTISAYPYKRIDVAEISPSIVLAAEKYFEGPNRGSLKDPRVHLLMNDGRNVLLTATTPYDLITIELTSVWFAGAANLYSIEFYELCRDRLRAGGILQQWVQLHHIRRRDLAVVLRTLRKVFPHVALFVSGGQGILVAGMAPLQASREELAALAQRPAIRETLGEIPSLTALVDRLLLSGEELDRFIADSDADGSGQLSTDENLYLEYETPKGNVMSYHASYNAMLELLTRYQTPAPHRRHLVP